MQTLTWSWRSHTIGYTVVEPPQALPPNGSPQRRAVLCIHGFGASKGHWRHNLTALAVDSPVYAIDLLGFGDSSKPVSQLRGEAALPGAVRYGFDLWAEQVVAFCQEVIGSGVALQLIGNSIGGVVALNAALVLWAAGLAANVAEAVPMALEAMAAGTPWQRLLALRSALT